MCSTGISEGVCWVGTDRDWDLSLRMTERYLWALSVIQHRKELASNVANELATGSCITEQVKRLAGNEIELGMEIPTIESRASNIPIDKGNYICCHKVRPIKIFIQYVGTKMGIQVPLLVIDRRGVSVMSTSFSNPSGLHA